MATQATSTFLHKLWEYHLDRRSEKTLYNTPVLYEFADKRPLPGKAGTTIYIPRHLGQNLISELTEYTVRGASGTSAGTYTGTVKGYGDARQYSDFQMDTLMVPTMISDDINSMVQYAGYKIDSLIAAQISGSGTWVKPDGAAAEGEVVDTTNLKQRFLFDARATLAQQAALTYSDNCYWMAVSPAGTHDLFVQTSAGGSHLGTIGASFLEQTEWAKEKMERASIGKLGGIRVVETNNLTRKTGAAAVGGVSADNSGYQVFVMGPGAVAAVDLQTSKLKTFVKARGSAGTADPIDQITTAGVKFYFTAVAMDVSNRLVRSAHGLTI